MKNIDNKSLDKKRSISLLLSIIFVFLVLSCVVFLVDRKTNKDMSDATIQNLNESLDLVECTIEAILNKEAEFQKLIAESLAGSPDPEEHILNYRKNETMAKLSFIAAGESVGVESNGDVFYADDLEFPEGREINGLPVSTSYVNYMGSWAFTIKCPVVKDGGEVGSLYVEYTFDALDKSLPRSFFNNEAMLYIMDAQTERFVLKPKGMGERNAGHLNLNDYYRANNIIDESLCAEVRDCIAKGKNMMFYHKIRGAESLNYVWATNGGTYYLVGYVPVNVIQRASTTVRYSIIVVVAVMAVAFLICCLLYYRNLKRQNKIRAEREAEREEYNKQLAEALQAAQQASRSKTAFLSNMSHDIRTPMNAVLGFTTLLGRDAENPAKVREYTKKITSSGLHLLSLINDVLDISKIESGKVVLNLAEFELSDLLSSIDAIIRPMAADKEQIFTIESTNIKHEYFIGDETRINQVLINLLSNAIKYTPKGGRIDLRILGQKQRSDKFEYIRIEVEDNGYGMTPEYLKTIFDAFTRAENSTTNKVQGTGLGMAITKNIVELMGGTIEVTSEVDKGSKFVVDWEFRISEKQSDVSFWKHIGISRILVATINPTLRNEASARDDGTSVEVGFADSGKSAVNMISKYDMAFIDWEDPNIGGFDNVKAMRDALPAEKPITLYMTAGNEDEAAEALKLGNIGVLYKPFFLSAFKNKLSEMLRASDSAEDDSKGEERLDGLHFLAAEDNEINAEILGEILNMNGASCVIAENGKIALETFESSGSGEFDAILMDVQMPVMNGYDATRAIRALTRPDAQTIPIIAMTANAFAEDERDALNAGMNVHIAKPIDIQLLKKVIHQFTNK